MGFQKMINAHDVQLVNCRYKNKDKYSKNGYKHRRIQGSNGPCSHHLISIMKL